MVMFGLNMFLLLTYFCGTYLPIGWISPSLAKQGQIFSWNPFVNDQDFLIKLQKAANSYNATLKKYKSFDDSSTVGPTTRSRRKKVEDLISEKDMEKNAACALQKYWGLRLAKSRPKLYLRRVSYLMLLTEMATLLVPMVAMGCQWMTALCRDTPTVTAIFSLTYWSIRCMIGGEEDMCASMNDSCIMASTN